MIAEIFQASYLQESLYRSAPRGESAVNVGVVLELRGPLEVPRLVTALRALTARHEALRTTLAEMDGGVCQVIAPSVDVSPAVLDASGEDDPEAEAMRLVRDYLRRPFWLHGPSLLRAMLIACRPGLHVLALSLHHAVFDGWSAGVLVADLREAYRAAGVAEPAAERDAPLQAADYAYWERQPADQAAFEGWRERLRGYSPRIRVHGTAGPGPEQIALPCDLPGDDPAAAEGVERLARQLRVPVVAVLAAAVAASLAEYAGHGEAAGQVPGEGRGTRPGLVLGLVRANRERAELRDVVGYLADVAPLPIDLGGDPDFAALVGRAADAVAFSREYPVPLGALAGLLRRRGDGPVFDVCLNYLPGARADGPGDDDLRMTPVEVRNTGPVRGPWWAGTALIDYVLRPAGPGLLTGRVRGDLGTFPPGLVSDLADAFWAALLRGTRSPELPVSELAVGVRGAAR